MLTHLPTHIAKAAKEIIRPTDNGCLALLVAIYVSSVFILPDTLPISAKHIVNTDLAQHVKANDTILLVQ